MNDTARPKTAIYLFLFFTVAFSSVFYWLLVRAGSLQAPNAGIFTFGLMWCPGIAALLTRLILQSNLRGEGWGLGKTKYLIASYCIPLAYASVVYLPLWAAGYADFSVAKPQVFAFLRNLSLPPSATVIAEFAILATLGVLSTSVSAMGEELGWRGLLVPELARVTSFPRVAVYSGIIWALWHLPPIILLDYHGKGGVAFSIICFFVLAISVSFLYAWIRLKSGSVWPCVLLHASHNVFIQDFFDTRTRSTGFTDYAIGEFGFGLALISIVLAVVFYRKRDELPIRY